MVSEMVASKQGLISDEASASLWYIVKTLVSLTWGRDSNISLHVVLMPLHRLEYQNKSNQKEW
jgi:hypothetical protein